jgi:hypothetical protein
MANTERNERGHVACRSWPSDRAHRRPRSTIARQFCRKVLRLHRNTTHRPQQPPRLSPPPRVGGRGRRGLPPTRIRSLTPCLQLCRPPYNTAARRLKLHRRQCSRATPHRSTPVMRSGVAVPYQHWIRQPAMSAGPAQHSATTQRNESG